MRLLRSSSPAPKAQCSGRVIQIGGAPVALKLILALRVHALHQRVLARRAGGGLAPHAAPEKVRQVQPLRRRPPIAGVQAEHPEEQRAAMEKTKATSTHATESATASCTPFVPTRPSLDLLPLTRAHRLRRRSIKLRITPQPVTLGSELLRTIVMCSAS